MVRRYMLLILWGCEKIKIPAKSVISFVERHTPGCVLSNEIQSPSKIDPVILARDSRQTLSRGMRVWSLSFPLSSKL